MPMAYFGQRLDAPVYDHADRIDTPVGSVCWWCLNEIAAGDCGFQLGDGSLMHRDCLLRSVLGPRAADIVEPLG